jgi:anti-anti-sigma factor
VIVEFIQENHNGWLIIEIPRDMNYEGNLALKNKIETLSQKNEPKICLDLSKTDYIGSATLGVFSFAQKHIDTKRGEFRLLAPKTNVRQMLEVMGLTKIIKIVEDKEHLG